MMKKSPRLDGSLSLTPETPDRGVDKSVTVSERCSLVAYIYQSNTVGADTVLTKLSNTHSFKVDVRDKPVDERSIAFDHDDCPYLKVALVDTYIDELLEK